MSGARSGRRELLVGATGIWLCGVNAVSAGATSEQAPQPGSTTEGSLDFRSEPRLADRVSVTVRAASMSEVVRQLGGAVGLRLTANENLSEEFVSLHLKSASVLGVMQSLAHLQGATWQMTPASAGEPARYVLTSTISAETSSFQRTVQRRKLFVTALQSAAEQIHAGNTSGLAASLRGRAAAAGDAVLSTAEFALPLRGRIGATFSETGAAWVPFARLTPTYLKLFGELYMSDPVSGEALSQDDRLAVLRLPNARVEFKIVYGDVVTGPLFLCRVGIPDRWASVELPSNVLGIPDDSSSFRDAQAPTAGSELYKTLHFNLDLARTSCDQALEKFADAAGVSLVSDSFVRPVVFRDAGSRELKSGTGLEMLRRICDEYGLLWWKLGDTYLVRRRLWSEERRVQVPARLANAIGADASTGGRLSASTVASLASLTDGQLMTLNLTHAGAGTGHAPVESFDDSEIQLVRSALVLFSSLTPELREAARAEGVAAAALPNSAQRAFLAVASDRSYRLSAAESDRWRLRIRDEIRSEKGPFGWFATGVLEFFFDFGSTGVKRAKLGLRAPLSAGSGGTARAS